MLLQRTHGDNYSNEYLKKHISLMNSLTKCPKSLQYVFEVTFLCNTFSTLITFAFAIVRFIVDTNNSVGEREQQIFTKSLLNYSGFKHLSDDDMLLVLKRYQKGFQVSRSSTGELVK